MTHNTEFQNVFCPVCHALQVTSTVTIFSVAPSPLFPSVSFLITVLLLVMALLLGTFKCFVVVAVLVLLWNSFGTVSLNSKPFLFPHSNNEQHKYSFFVHTTTDWNHLSDYQMKAPTLEDFKQRIVTQSTIWFAHAHSPPVASIPKIRSSDVSHQDQDHMRRDTPEIFSIIIII